MAERDRAKRALLLRLAIFVCLPILGLAVAGLAAGALWGLVGLIVGLIAAVAVTKLLPK